MFGAGVRFGGDIVLFRKAVLTVEGVAADVSPDTSLGRVLPSSGSAQLLREWSQRWCNSPFSRGFGTHVSNLDLLSLYFAAPSAASRVVWDWIFSPARQRRAADDAR
jgi:hypothetical protein